MTKTNVREMEKVLFCLQPDGWVRAPVQTPGGMRDGKEEKVGELTKRASLRIVQVLGEQ